VLAACITKTEENHTRTSRSIGCDDFAEVKVECEDHALLGDGFAKDIAVWQSLESLLSQMGHVVPRVTEPPRDSLRDSHIGQESHAADSLREVDLFLRQPRRVLQGLLNVF